MDMTFFPVPLEGVVSVPVSKIEDQCRLICAGLSEGTTMLKGFANSDEMAAIGRCLKALGAKIEIRGDTLIITGHVKKTAKQPLLDCGDSGAVLRFFVPIALASAGGGVFRMHGDLGRRPLDIYRDLYVPQGIRWRMGVGCDGAAELTMRGELEAGHYVMPGNVSGPFVAGLLFALPLLEGDSMLTVEAPAGNAEYIRMAVAAMQRSGIVVEEQTACSWRIAGRQAYQAWEEPLACEGA